MIESEFLQIFVEAAKLVSENDLIIKTKSNLLYELFLNKKLHISPSNTSNPKRGILHFKQIFAYMKKLMMFCYLE